MAFARAPRDARPPAVGSGPDLARAIWLLGTVVSFVFAAALARTRVEEITIGVVGLTVVTLVLAASLSALRGPTALWARLGLSRIDMPLTCLLAAAVISFATSVVFWFFVDRTAGMFVGLWVPSILSLAAVIQLARH
jgi:hypothetical protein